MNTTPDDFYTIKIDGTLLELLGRPRAARLFMVHADAENRS